MKKILVSTVLGLVLSAIPVSIYAACADIITSGPYFCTLSGKYTVNGREVCEYTCATKDQPAPQQPAQPGTNE